MRHRRLLVFSAIASTLLAASAASAQPPAPAPTPAPAAPHADTSAPCHLGDHAGIDDDDAATATRVVCTELGRAGAPLGARYRVSLGKLGSVVILSVEREGDAGAAVDSRETRLQGIEEVTVVAPRLADALVHGKPMQATETVNNLSDDETRAPRSKPAKTHFALGLIGMFGPLDRGLHVSPGVSFEVHAETNPFEIVGNLRLGGATGNDGAGHGSLSIGGRYFPMDTDSSPYVGGGFAWSYFHVSETNTSGEGNSGLGAYFDGGFEVMRTRHAHLALGARLDLPFFELNGSTGITALGAPVSTSSLYYAPLSIEARLTF